MGKKKKTAEEALLDKTREMGVPQNPLLALGLKGLLAEMKEKDLSLTDEKVKEVLGRIKVGGPEKVIHMRFGGGAPRPPQDPVERMRKYTPRLEKILAELKAATTEEQFRLLWEEVDSLAFMASGRGFEALPKATDDASD